MANLLGGSGGQGQPFNPVSMLPTQQGSFFGGSPASFATTQRYTPNQQNLQNQSIQQIMSLLQGGKPYGFDALQNQARENFQQNTIPSLAERFTAMGGGQRSSAFQGALGNAAGGLESSLAGLGAQLGQQQLGQLLPYGFAQSFDTQYMPRESGFLENILSSLLGGAGQGLGQAGGQQGLLKLLSLLA
jgi:hypothetical protein